MSQSFILNKQRGIYSEIINPDNSVLLQESFANQHDTEGSFILTQTKKQRIPKAKKLNQSFQNGHNSSFNRGAASKKGKYQTPNQTLQIIQENQGDIYNTVDPKVLEPYEPIPDRVPRQVAIDRKKKEYSSYDLEELIMYQPYIDFRNKDQQSAWLPLRLFDDTDFDDYSNQDWIKKQIDEDGKKRVLTGKALYQEENCDPFWRKVIVKNYDQNSDQFICQWMDNSEETRLHRIYICLDAEDPKKYIERVANAFKERIYADTIIKYNYYIDNMPREDLAELDTEQQKRLTNLVQSKNLSSDITTLLQEVNEDYKRTMNKIIFDKYLQSEKTDEELEELQQMLPNLNFPEDFFENTQEIKEFGMMKLERYEGAKLVWMYNYEEPHEEPPKDLTQTFKEFCFSSLYIKEEVITALQEIKMENDHVLDMNIFQLDLQPGMVLDQFKHIQESSISQIMYHLKGQWILDLIKIIKSNFEGVGKGWFNMKETSKITYDFGKLKKFLTLIRLKMQDTVFSLVQKSYHDMSKFIMDYVPQKVSVNSPSSVVNDYGLDEKYRPRKVEPLFNIDLIKSPQEDRFLYNILPQNFVLIIVHTLEKGLEEMSKIPDLEPKILADLHKANKNETYIKAPMKPRERPLDPDPNERPKKYPDENKWIWDLIENIRDNLNKAITPLDQYLEVFGEFKEVLLLSPEEYVHNLEQDEENPLEIEQIQELIIDSQEKERKLKEEIPDHVHVSFFSVQTTQIREHLCDKYYTLSKILIELIAKKARQQTQAIFNQFQFIQNKIKENPEDIELLTELREYMANIPQEMEKMKIEMNKCFGIFSILEQFNYKFSKEDIDRRWNVFGSPLEIVDLIEKRVKELDKDKNKFLEEMKIQQEELKESIDNLEQTIQSFHSYQVMEEHVEVAAEAENVNNSLQQFIKDARKFNSREALFESDETTNYDKINQMVKEFTPYSNLWITANKWFKYKEEWMSCPWDELNATEAEKFVEDASRTIQGVIRYFKNAKQVPGVLAIAETIKSQLEEFKPKVPLMVALRKPGMIDRHWKQISEKLGKEVKPYEEFTFTNVLEAGLMEIVEDCVEIGEKAYKEHQIETMLKSMTTKWETINFNIMPYKDVHHIIKGYDEIQIDLDEHIVNTQAMQFSPFKKPYEEQIMEWNNTLKLISDVLEEWAKCQGQWMYLQPIFDSPDIAKQLPAETKKFKTVDATWKYTIGTAKQMINVLKVCTQEGLLERLQEANKNLEIIQKELNNYLEKKREKFARFYFLSNDDLLEILSQTKEPTAVQPHLKKVFENIHEIEFNSEKKILAMMSAEKEKVRFVNAVDPVKKNVEDWMEEVEQMMMKSVRAALLHSVQDYQNQPRTEWVKQHPGQCVLNGSQVIWTKEVEEAILKDTKTGDGIRQYWEKLQEQLIDLVDLVRTPLKPQEKITLNALIVIDVHAKDVVQKLVQEKINNIQGFEWISQLRYYWADDDCYVDNVQTHFPYGYEYLGNTLRLVITPLTDKCYITLMGALKLNLGGAPAGPAGTGKTESTKDLAKALAKQCVVFNCSDSMDYIMVGKFFKGLASAGAWCCFDEFNRINIEVLSVIAQQLLILFGEKAKGTPTIEFEGSIIKLLPTFCVFITMNPGYAGRTELPDNLKALFRAVAMMVPDYAMIGEIMLYSFGFKKGRELAKKMVATFKLSSEQLSSQDHYDYGMRAVRSVINAAGLLKAQEPDQDEEKLMLRGLRDVNVPKFLKDDIPLFENIILDLFPGVERPQVQYGKLLEKINEKCYEFNLQPNDPFVGKVLQLYDTIQVRHGLMTVGPTGGGKTKNYQVLSAAMTALKNEGQAKVQCHIMNPKSITMGQLYGQFNEQTHEWSDGILAYKVRECCRDQSITKHWVIFDGPVDSLWIESMNTVLDDNKKLCLNSGQILTLTPHMTMMFEVEDLFYASPATVSRCGMIYMEPESLGYQCLIQSWFNTVPQNIIEFGKIKEKLQNMWDNYIDEGLMFLRENLHEPSPTSNNQMIASLYKILDCYFVNFTETEIKKIPNEELKVLEDVIEALYVFSFIWSLGASTDYKGREKFDAWIKNFTKEKKFQFSWPDEGSVYDYEFKIDQKQFVSWDQRFLDFSVPQNAGYHEVSIPTTDSTRNSYLMEMMMRNGKHILCTGPTGTGKTQNIMQLLTLTLDENFQYINVMFSAQTSANQTQDSIDSKIDKRRKGVFGPPIGKKAIIFVDDMNMPKKEVYAAQPPIELIRQYLDHSGWYNRRDLQFMKIEDTIILGAMGTPGGGRTFVSNRIVRHFNVFGYTQLNQQTISQIFTTLVSHFLRRYSEPIKEAIPQLIQSVLNVYNQVNTDLLPTPSKSHYTFNLRDIWKVFQGMVSSTPKQLQDVQSYLKIFYHENMRIFHDRLINDQDRDYLKDLLNKEIKRFGFEKEQVIDQERIIFGDFMQGREADPRVYQQVSDLGQLLNQMDAFQEDFNSDATFVFGGPKKQMKLVMFLDACEHIARIARIIRQPSGHALLMGVGGSGRQSLSRMATFLNNYKIFQIEVIKNYNTRSWRDDIKKVLMYCGIENKPLTFLITDTQIIRESMMEDINSILNSGDVTGLYQDKETEDIITACKHECVKRQISPTKINIFIQYLARVQKNIHMVIAFSPLGSMCTTRLRMFPSLVNNCVIDWFSEWPEEALIGVGRGQLSDYEDELEITGQIDTYVDIFKNIHKSVEHESANFLDQLRRHNYVTPTSYLELLTMFRTIMIEKKKEINLGIKRLKSGLDKLMDANKSVEEMQVQLKDMEPELVKASEETEKMMEVLSKEKAEALETQTIVAKEEAEASKQEQQARQLGAEAEAAVAEANKSLEQTLLQVKQLKKEHLTEIRSLGSPPQGVKVTLGGVVILLLEQIKKKGGDIITTPDPNNLGKKIENHFETAKRFLLNDTGQLMEMIDKYDKDSIPPSCIQMLREKILTSEYFNLDVVSRCSFATKFLFLWVQAMHEYYKVFTETAPLRAKLEEMKQIVKEKTQQLAEKKAELEKVNKKIADLQAKFDEKLKQKQELTDKIDECQIKLDRAQKLTNGLSEEKERWGKDIDKLVQKSSLIPAHSIISAGMISYIGPFTSQYRQKLEQQWVSDLAAHELEHDPEISMRGFLGVPVKIQTWNINGLPKDDTSTENGIIIDKGRRWPLMIDPQTQANKFIKNIGKDHEEGIEIMKINDQNLMKNMELAVQFGRMILLENVGTELDPSLEPILQQQVVKQGSSLSITIGDKTLAYNEKFKLFLTTTLPNPHYPPETFVKVTIINFAITPNGLEEQMLAQIVALENPALEQRKTDIVRKNAADQKQLLKIEDDILKSLSETGDIESILKDESLINQLQSSKKFAAEINQRVKESKIVELDIDKGRESYRSVAYRASILFFCIVDLANIDPMYQYSLQWFINLFVMGVENSTQSPVLEERLKNLNDYFTYSLYENVCRSLFEKHKLMFSLMLTVKILEGDSKLDMNEWRYLLTGPSGDIEIAKNPTSYIPENSWSDIYRQIYGADKIASMQGIEAFFMENPEEFKEMFDSSEAHEIPMPAPWNEKLNEFQKLIFLKSLRPDKLIPGIQNYISNNLGEPFIVVPIFELGKCYKDSTVTTPLVFVLSSGSDPVSDFLKFADEMQMSKRFESISLGQGQGPKAEKIVRDASQRGSWVLLQNCHLAQSWMPDLEKLCEELNENMHKDFRLWLTSMPSIHFPISVLQNSIKMTVEPPSGLRQNLLRTYKNMTDEELINCEKPDQFRKLLFGFALFHAIIQDRRKFGPIGWNIPYDFTNEDFDVCKKQLKMLLDEYKDIPYKAINFLGSQINYGGRVTDDKDVRLISVILKTYINRNALRDGFKYSESGHYKSIQVGSLDDYIDYINNLPLNPSPEAFGLHDNAQITNAQNETRTLLENILLCQPRSSSNKGKSREELIEDLATFIQEKTPELFDIAKVQKYYPTSYEESLNTVLFQEVIRYNRLIQVMKESLVNLKKGIKGIVVLSEELEQVGNSLFDNHVPDIWAEKGFLSLKPLSSWIVDLNDRINFLSQWIQEGTPKVFWFSGFFFPQAFITGVTQNYARKHVIAIDQLEFDFLVTDDKEHTEITEKPEDGCYIYGMYLEGAKWDSRKHQLGQPTPKELFSSVPMMQLIPVQNRQAPTEGVYNCPLYKSVDRKGTLSTTGHSTNFVMFLEFTSKEHEDQWIKAGVAAFLALRY